MTFLYIAFIIFVALVPGIAWLLFFLREDVHPEPRKRIIYTFGLGIIISAPVVLFQVFGQSYFTFIGGSIFITIIFFALIEEIFKLLAAYLSVGKTGELDEPVDFMIYMVAAALGLATIENFFIIADIITTGGIEIISELSGTIALRFIGATFLHAVASGLLGFYWAKMRQDGNYKHIFVGIIIATALHAVFNFLVLAFQNIDYLIYPSLFLLIASFVLFKDFEKIKETNK